MIVLRRDRPAPFSFPKPTRSNLPCSGHAVVFSSASTASTPLGSVPKCGSDGWFQPRMTQARCRASQRTTNNIWWPCRETRHYFRNCRALLKHVCTGVYNCEGLDIAKSQDEWHCIRFVYSDRFQTVGWCPGGLMKWALQLLGRHALLWNQYLVLYSPTELQYETNGIYPYSQRRNVRLRQLLAIEKNTARIMHDCWGRFLEYLD